VEATTASFAVTTAGAALAMTMEVFQLASALRRITAILTATLVLQGAAQEGGALKLMAETHVPIRAITQGPEGNWFGYYDKLQFDPTDRYALGMQVTFQGRSPSASDNIGLRLIDLHDNDRSIEFGQSLAWSWQQGCMLQWLPGSSSEVIYNDRQDGQFVAVIQDVFTGARRTLPKPIYAVAPDGKTAVGVNFARIDETRPGYGYKGVEDPYRDQPHPQEDGIYVLNLETGEHRAIISLDQIAAVPSEHPFEGKHWFNHLLFNPDGARFIFLHRARKEQPGPWLTRMFTAAPDGSAVFNVADHKMVSHFIWKNPQQILAWSTEPETGNRFHLYTDQTDQVEVVGEGVLTHDGHCTYSPDGNWILTDSYPDKENMQSLMLFRPSDQKLVTLGRFYMPPEVKGKEWRCDLHPRWSRDGRYVCIDSMHEDNRRQMYLLDVSSVLASD
jgi:hypothetical protein